MLHLQGHSSTFHIFSHTFTLYTLLLFSKTLKGILAWIFTLKIL
uniref:Uncharacterized protein n=1 Tax=Anguilla anguilla TaxID=7936 RepID=A0A0E9SEK8_ANGAN